MTPSLVLRPTRKQLVNPSRADWGFLAFLSLCWCSAVQQYKRSSYIPLLKYKQQQKLYFKKYKNGPTAGLGFLLGEPF